MLKRQDVQIYFDYGEKWDKQKKKEAEAARLKKEAEEKERLRLEQEELDRKNGIVREKPKDPKK